MVIVAFALIIFFAVKTRSKMDRYDKSNILWDKEHIYDEHPPNVEEWVSVVKKKKKKEHMSGILLTPRFLSLNLTLSAL